VRIVFRRVVWLKFDRSAAETLDMPASRHGSLLQIAGGSDADARAGAGHSAARLARERGGGQVFTDLLLLASLSCQAPVSLVSVRQPDGSWTTLAHGLEGREALNDPQLFEALAAATEPVEITDMVSSVPRSPLVIPPYSMRWAYGVAMRDESGTVIGAVAVLDRWLRQLSKREQRAMGAVSRQMAAHLSQWRRQPASDSSAASAAPVGRPGANEAGPTAHVEQAAQTSRVVASVSDERHPLLRSQEVAEIFDVTERTVINWAAAGKLPCLRTIGGHLRFRREEVLRLLSGDGS
jgi:excisionase family DNA binding protein